ncbi:MAG: serine/threonine-protein kinase, partial [Bryobacteraceae bacterium]
MNHDVRILFREVASLSPDLRRDHYARKHVPAAVCDELESLLEFDSNSGSEITSVVGAAAERFLVASAPVEEGRCGAYRLLRLIGNGGMGAVYLAERADGEVEQRVAIKFVRSGADLPSFRSRFLRERQILASLNHPGIARLLDVGTNEGQPYLVMEHVEGVRIDEHAEALDLRGKLDLFAGAAEAVSYAHRNLVIHRDLKPSNILVDAAGQPKLLDFGIAKILDDPEQTRTMDRAHTPEYASPEQVGGEAQSTATDIYSLGAVLQRIVTGRSPKSRGSHADMAPDLAAIVSKAMRDEPEARYASVDQMIADVRAFLEHRPVEARRGNALYHARKFLRRRWLPMAAVALALAGIAGGVIIADRQRALAEQRFLQVRRLSKQFLDLDADVQTLPGATKARHRIVSASLEYLGGLRAERDPELALEIAEAYLKVARVQGVPVGSNLGQFADARVSLERAGALAEPLTSDARFARRRDALRLSAEVERDLMIVTDSEKRRPEAAAHARKAAERLEALLAEPGISNRDRSAAARLFVNIGQAMGNMHRIEEGARYARRSVELSRAAGDDLQLGRGLGILANQMRFAGDLDGALAAIRESRMIAEKFSDPGNLESQVRLSGALWREGLILGEYRNISLDRPREAEVLLTRAYDVAEAMARKDPRDYASRSYLSMAGRELGDVLRDRDPARALTVYEHARHRLSEIPGNSKVESDVVWLLTGASYPLRRLGRPVEARQRIDEAIAILRTLGTYPANRIAPGEDVDVTLRALGDHLAATGDISMAIRTYEDLVAKAAGDPREDLRNANGLSRIYEDLANLYARAGRRKDAAACDQRRRELWRHWDAKL